MKATDFLRKQHRDVLSLLKKALATDGGDRRELVDQICESLKLHTMLEEQIFYPAYREAVGTKKGTDRVDEAYQEHHVVDLVLDELPRVDVEDDSFHARITVLKELVEHHVEEEQEEMFPSAEKKLGKERLEELAEEMQARMQHGDEAEAHGAAAH